MCDSQQYAKRPPGIPPSGQPLNPRQKMKQKHYDVESMAKLQKTWHLGKDIRVNICMVQAVLSENFLFFAFQAPLAVAFLSGCERIENALDNEVVELLLVTGEVGWMQTCGDDSEAVELVLAGTEIVAA